MRYDHEALVGILALEAQRAGALVVGEDLGTVEPWVRDYLARARHPRHVDPVVRARLATAGTALPPEQWRELCLATVTTHDLPPTAGYLAGEHIRIRAELGLLTRSVEEERRVDAADREPWLDLLVERGWLGRGRRARRARPSTSRCTGRWPRHRAGCSGSRSPTRSATGGR